MQQEQTKLTFEQSLQTLIDGVLIAQKRGSYTLQESSIMYQAVLTIQQKTKETKVETI